MGSAALLLLLLLAFVAGMVDLGVSVGYSPAVTTASARQVVPFDYAWRFRTVPSAPPPAPPATWRKACPAFNATSSDTCSGLVATPAGNGSAASCRQQCCNNAECYVWQYSLVPASDRCWTGQCKSPGPDVSTWISQAAPVPSKPHPAPPAPPAPHPPQNDCAYCGVEVDDSDWELIDAPHDFIITQPISKAENNGAGSVSDILRQFLMIHVCAPPNIFV